MNMKFAAIAALGTLLARRRGAASAPAADNGFYLGAGLTKTEFDVDDIGRRHSMTTASSSSPASARSTGWPSRPITSTWAAKTMATLRLDSRRITVSVLLIDEVGVIDLYAQARHRELELECQHCRGRQRLR